MSSIENPKDKVIHRSCFPDVEMKRVSMMSPNLGLGGFSMASIRIPRLNPFLARLYFLKLITKFFASHYTKYLCFISPLHLDGNLQRALISHENTHDECLHMHKFVTMWHFLDMVCHMMSTSTHNFLYYENHCWPKRRNMI
jgi:hypothetical protein